MKKAKEFNIVICGVGGQGIITLLRIIAQAAFLDGYDVRTSELHGLSQRGGSIKAHIRFGEKIFSPLILPGMADLMLALDITESLRVSAFANKDTVFLINEKFTPFFGGPRQEDVHKKLKKLTGKIHLINASAVCQKEFKKEVLSGVYLVSRAVFEELIPLSPKSLSKAIETVVAEKYISLNKKVFAFAQKNVS